MKIISIYNYVVLPDSHLYLRGDNVKGVDGSDIEIGDDIIILPAKSRVINTINLSELYGLGVFGKVEDKKNGILVIKTKHRVRISQITNVGNNQFEIKIEECPSIDDLSKEEEDKILNKLRNDILKFVQNYEWGFFARGFILDWKNINDMMISLSEFIHLSHDEKYALLSYSSALA